MAADTNNMFDHINLSSKTDRAEMNKLRDSGQVYVSCSGKLMPAKTQPAIFCHCPQLCPRKLPKPQWKQLFQQFYSLCDQNKQNTFLQTHIVIKTVHLHNWENRDKMIPANKRRVTCKYHVPRLQQGQHLEAVIDKLSEDTVEVCQKAFMNVFGITEKRVRMQRERCIAALAPDYYRKSPYENGNVKENYPEKSATPMDLSTDKSKDSEEEDEQQPLDLSHQSDHSEPSEPSPIPIEIDKNKLYELADMLGVPRSTVDREMVDKYEELVRKNLAKQTKELLKHKKQQQEFEIRTVAHLKGISEQVVGLQDNLTILPIQTLNNGDLTITPVLGPSAQPVENHDIMQVNSFFQNQLWRPEYIGLTGKLEAALAHK